MAAFIPAVAPATAGVLDAANPARGIGVNCFDLFYGPLTDERRVRKPSERFAELADWKVPFVRFAASPFWPREWGAYTTQRDRYLQLMDSIFEHAQRRGIGLVPSLFWNPASVSDRMGESLAAWAQPGSRTVAFAKSYTEDMLRRYGASSPLCHWEFGNEFNVNLDLRDQYHWWPKVNVEMGTPAARSAQDSLSTADFQWLMKQFAEWVRLIRPTAQISSGADRPRPEAFNLSKGSKQIDTPAEFRQAVCIANPIAGGVASMHLYPDFYKRYFGGQSTVLQLLREAKAGAAQCGQRLLLGEFGVEAGGHATDERELFQDTLNAIEQAGIEAAALWVYDFRWQPKWSVTPTNERAWQWQAVAALNARRSHV